MFSVLSVILFRRGGPSTGPWSYTTLCTGRVCHFIWGSGGSLYSTQAYPPLEPPPKTCSIRYTESPSPGTFKLVYYEVPNVAKREVDIGLKHLFMVVIFTRSGHCP